MHAIPKLQAEPPSFVAYPTSKSRKTSVSKGGLDSEIDINRRTMGEEMELEWLV